MLPFLGRPKSDTFWSCSQQGTAEKSLSCHADLESRGPQWRGSRGRVRQPPSMGAASQEKPDAHLSLFVENTMVPPSHCWRRSRLPQRTQGFATVLRKLRHQVGISDAWKSLGQHISDSSRCKAADLQPVTTCSPLDRGIFCMPDLCYQTVSMLQN